MKLTKTDRNKFKTDLCEGDLVQIHPNVKGCGGCFMIVTETDVGGCLGYINLLDGQVRHAKVKIMYSALQRIGVPEWVEDWGRPKECT